MTTVSCRSLTSIRLKTTLHWQRRRSQNSAALPVKMPQAASLNELLFEHTALECLPVDPNPDRDVRREIPGTCFSLVDTQPLESPEVVCLSQNALDLLGVQVDEQDPSTPKLLSLGTTFSNCKTYAHCYCGHQFGSFAGAQSSSHPVRLNSWPCN